MCSTCFADGLHALLQRRSVCHITACPPRCRALPHDNIHHGPKLSRRLAVLGLSSVPAGATTVNGSAEAGQIGEGRHEISSSTWPISTRNCCHVSSPEFDLSRA